MKQRDYQRRYYEQRKAKGCVDCGRATTKSASRCSCCARTHAAQAKERYQRSKVA